MLSKEEKQELVEEILEGEPSVVVKWATAARWGHWDHYVVAYGDEFYKVSLRFHSEEGLQNDYTAVVPLDRTTLRCPTCKGPL